MIGILVGIFFIGFSAIIPYESTALRQTFDINIIPDFIGYLAIWFSVEKLSSSISKFKFCSSAAATLAVINFLGFLGQLRFLIPNNDFSEGGVFNFIFEGVSIVYDGFYFVFVAINMLFLAFLAFSLFSLAERDQHPVMMKIFGIFSVLYLLITVFGVIRNFVDMPIDLWMVVLPVGLLFMLFAGLETNRTKEFIK